MVRFATQWLGLPPPGSPLVFLLPKLLHRVKTSRPHPSGKEGGGMAGIRARLLEALATGPIFLHRGASSFAFSSSSCSLSSSSFAFSFSPFSLFSSLFVRPLFLVARPLPRRSPSRLPGHPNFSVVFTERSFRDTPHGPPTSWVPPMFLSPPIHRRTTTNRPHPFGKGRGGCGATSLLR